MLLYVLVVFWIILFIVVWKFLLGIRNLDIYFFCKFIIVFWILLILYLNELVILFVRNVKVSILLEVFILFIIVFEWFFKFFIFVIILFIILFMFWNWIFLIFMYDLKFFVWLRIVLVMFLFLCMRLLIWLVIICKFFVVVVLNKVFDKFLINDSGVFFCFFLGFLNEIVFKVINLDNMLILCCIFFLRVESIKFKGWFLFFWYILLICGLFLW